MEVASEGSNLMEKVMHPYVQVPPLKYLYDFKMRRSASRSIQHSQSGTAEKLLSNSSSRSMKIRWTHTNRMCTIDQQAHCGDLTPKEFKELLTSGMRDPAIQNILTDPVLRRGIRQSSCVLHKTNKLFQGRHIGNKRDVKVAIKTILEVDLIEVKGDRSKSVLFNAGRVAKGLRHLDEKYCKETWELLSSVVVM
ncbi:unnamed protein product [Brassica napus]|uniref:(rape) hypothetical protein n=1 Tax=Brassica napus TaxID=3708 RepID=A0A816SUC3_BRANA|nr:unnamed protein product [Brassica napus]